MDPRDRARQPGREADGEKPRYEKPAIVAHDETSLIDLVGPAVACARWDAGTGQGDDYDTGGDDDWGGGWDDR